MADQRFPVSGENLGVWKADGNLLSPAAVLNY